MQKLQFAEKNRTFVVELNVQENVLDVFFPFFAPWVISVVQFVANNIFHKCAHVVHEKSTTMILPYLIPHMTVLTELFI